MSDAQLVKRLCNGERRAYETLLDRYGARVQSLARRTTQSAADAEDLTQEIFLDVFQSIGSFRGEAQLSTWIYRVALHHCWRWRDKTSRDLERRDAQSAEELELPSPDRSGDPQRRAAQSELGAQVRAALSELSEQHREIVVLHELHGLTYAQCAQALQIPVGTAKSRLSNAFSHLRRALRPYVLDEEESLAPSPSLAPEGGSP